MSKARNLSDFISDPAIDSTEIGSNAITADKISDQAVTPAKLHNTLDLSSKTVTLPTDGISGNSIHGGVISSFASTGIDDNASSTAVTIDSSGNVGIGTDSPATKLDVRGTVQILNSNAKLQFSDTSRISELYTFNGGRDLRIEANQDVLLNSSGGNVGIGTTSPAEKVEVNGSFKVGNLKIQNANGGRIGFNRNTANGDIYDSNFAAFQINGAYAGADFMAFEAYNSGGVGTDAMAIRDNGNVGIGTTSPNAKLDVRGNLKLYNASSDPAGTAGDLYYNTTNKTVKFHNGGGWVRVTSDVTPDQFSGLYSWWDFGGTYSAIGSGNSTISDASGNGYTLTEGGTCTTESFPSGRNGIRVGANAGNHWYTSNAVPAEGADARTLFAIFYNIKDTNADPLYHVMHYGTATTNRAFGIVQDDTGLYFHQHTWSGDGTTSSPGSYAMNQTGAAGVMIVFSIYTGSGGKLRIYDDGTSTGVNYTSSYTPNTGNAYGMRIGSRINETNSNEAADVVMGECGAYTRELSDGEMDQLALGLLQRWT